MPSNYDAVILPPLVRGAEGRRVKGRVGLWSEVRAGAGEEVADEALEDTPA